MNETLTVSEIFRTISGEGLDIGIPTIYVRLFGCNMNPPCPFCDTMYSVKKIDDTINTRTFDDIIKNIIDMNCKRVAFTGGEPFLYIDKIKVIMNRLYEKYPYEFHFETNGMLYDDVIIKYPTETVIAVSPKFHALNSSYYLSIHDWINKSEHNVFLKFVYEDNNTITNIKDLEKHVGGFGKRPVYIMPEGRGINKKLYQECYKVCIDNNWRMSPRLQCIVWDDMRGT